MIPALLCILELATSGRDDSKSVVFQTLLLLCHFGVDSSPAVPCLIEILQRSSNRDILAVAIRTLGSIGANAKPAIPALLSTLGNSHAIVRGRVFEALMRIGIGTTEVRDGLLKGVVDPHLRVRALAMSSLGVLPIDSTSEVVSSLITALKDSSRRVRSSAVWSLAKLKPKEAIPLLQALLTDDGMRGMEHLVRRAIDSLSNDD